MYRNNQNSFTASIQNHKQLAWNAQLIVRYLQLIMYVKIKF